MAPMRLFCQDEARFGLMPVQRRRITARGTKPVQRVEPSYENFYLYGAVEPATGERFLEQKPHLNTDGFQDFLDGFAARFSGSLNVMVLDNGSFHKAKKLAVPQNVELVFLPPYSPELNPAERLWQDLKDAVAFHLHESLAALKQKVNDLVESYTNAEVASLCGYPYLLRAAANAQSS